MKTARLFIIGAITLLLLPLVVAQGSGLTLTKLTAPPNSTQAVAAPIAWSKDSDYLAIADQVNPSAFVWWKNVGGVFTELADPATGLPTRPVIDMVWNPAGTILLVVSDSADSTCLRPFFRSGDTLTSIGTGAFDNQGLCTSVGMTSASWSPDGRAVALGHQLSPHLSVWAVSGSGLSTTFTKWGALTGSQIGGSGTRNVDWSDDSTFILACGDTGGTNGRLMIVRTTANAFVSETRPGFDRSSSINMCDLDKTGTLITTGWSTSSVGVVHFNGVSTFTDITYPGASVGTIQTSMRWDVTGTYIVTCGATSPFIRLTKRTGEGASATFANLGNPASLPEGTCYKPRWSPENAYLAASMSTSPGIVVYSTNIPQTPPDASVLTGAISGTPRRCVLTWTTPNAGGAPIQGYNITRTRYGTDDIILLGLVNTYSDFPHTDALSYTVHAWSSLGDGEESNSVTCQLLPMDLAGPQGVIWGGDQAGLAAAWGVPVTGISLLYAILLIIICAGTGALLVPPARVVGGLVGSVVGLFMGVAFQLIPIWVIFFLLVVGGAVFWVAWSRGRSSGGM